MNGKCKTIIKSALRLLSHFICQTIGYGMGLEKCWLAVNYSANSNDALTSKSKSVVVEMFVCERIDSNCAIQKWLEAIKISENYGIENGVPHTAHHVE